MDSGGSIGDPIFIVKRFRKINWQSHVPNEGMPEVLSLFIFICGYLWGVYHTLLPYRMKGFRKIDRQFSSPNEGMSEIRLAIPFS